MTQNRPLTFCQFYKRTKAKTVEICTNLVKTGKIQKNPC